ncbi:MAG: uroporphyrinogen-III C-methyltransferase [Gammaproteobacteria bacterium]
MNDKNTADDAQDLTQVSESMDQAEQPQADAEQATATAAKKPSRSRGPIWPGLLAIVVLLGTTAAAVFFWQQNEITKQRLTIAETRLSDQETRVLREVRELSDKSVTRFATLESQVQRLGGMQSELQRAMDSVRNFAAKGPTGWVLAEVEFLLKIANHRIHLSQDPETAMAALKGADERLASLADPGLIPVREKIAQEIQALRSVPGVDRAGIAAELKAMAEQVGSLPLPGRPDTSAGTQTGEGLDVALLDGPIEEAPARVWGEIKSLVTVRRHDKPVPLLLAPEEQYFLTWNLRLQLESARLNALRARQEPYQADLKAVSQDIQRYFLTEKPETQGFLQQVETLAQRPVAQDMPDISGSLRLLREQASHLISTLPLDAQHLASAGLPHSGRAGE